MSRNSKIAEPLRIVRATPPEPDNRGERITFRLLLAAIALLALWLLVVSLHVPQLFAPIVKALGG